MTSNVHYVTVDVHYVTGDVHYLTADILAIPIKAPRAELQVWVAKTNKNKNPPIGVFSGGVGAIFGRNLPGSDTSAQWVARLVIIMLLCTFLILRTRM